jgi:hypothetical protein
MTESPDWDALIQQHLDGQTTEQEATSLSEQIVADADVRSRYLKAAQVHGALADEVLALELEMEPDQVEVTTGKGGAVLHISWLQQIAAALVAGAVVGLLGVGVVWAVNSPKSEASIIPISNGSFETNSGPVDRGFPSGFGYWSGDPAEVIEQADGNRVLRFLETANVTGNPNGGTSASDVFQLIDLSSLRQQWNTENSEDQFTLELSARFHRKAAGTDAEVPRLKGTCTISLYQAEPESIGKAWPLVIRDAVALGKKAIRLKLGEESGTIAASCILAPEANIALISVNVNTMMKTKTPIKLGGYFVDDVQLTVIKQPNLPVHFVK